MYVIETDIAVVGAGGAGLRAAIAATEADPSLTLSLISKVYPMRSHTVAAEGGAAGVIKDNDSMDSISATPSPAETGSAIRMRSSCSSTQPPSSCCSWSTGAVHGAAKRTAQSPCGRSVA